MAIKNRKKEWLNHRNEWVPQKAIPMWERKSDQACDRLFRVAERLEASLEKLRQLIWQVVDDYSKWMMKRGKVKGDWKGNLTLQTFERSKKIVVRQPEKSQINDNIYLAQEKAKEFLQKRTKRIPPEVRPFFNRLFRLDTNRNLPQYWLNDFLKIEIDDPDWQEFKLLLMQSFDTVGNRRYAEFYRKNADGEWEKVNLSYR